MAAESAETNGSARPEEVYFDWHYQASVFCLRHTSSKVRSFLEFLFMLMGVSSFAALICLHHAFVYRGHPTTAMTAPTITSSTTSASTSNIRSSLPLTCLSRIPGFRQDADVTHLVLLRSSGEQGDNSSFSFELGENSSYNHTNEPTGVGSRVCSAANPDEYFCSSIEQDADNSSPFSDVYFSYSQVKGYVYMTPSNPATSTPILRGISSQIVAVSKSDTRCFGEPFLQHTVFRLLGPDIVMMNWLLAISDGTGYIYNPRTDKLLDLRQYHITNTRNSKPRGFNLSASTILDMSNWSSWFRPWATKFATALKTCLIYFISTNIVSFLLRVTQARLLELALQIRSHWQAGRSILPLFVTHVADSFVFVPITIGVVFFLREFYQGDWRIAMMVLIVLWFCEAFSFISVRSKEGVHFFPRAIFLLFALVHFYLFSFPFGFSYVAMGMIACFMTQCCLFFWNRYELPAVVLGLVDYPSRLEYSRTTGENNLITATHNILRHRSVTEESTIPAVASLGLSHTPPRENVAVGRPVSPEDPLRDAQPQRHRQRTIFPPFSQGNLSQGGRMSRASSEAIFHVAADGDDESESCVYFLGGEVVIRRGETRENQSNTYGSSNNLLARYDSTSTIQSGGVGLFSDESEASRSSLQAILDMTPRTSNANLSEPIEEFTNSSAPVVPVLSSGDSTPPKMLHQRHRNTI